MSNSAVVSLSAPDALAPGQAFAATVVMKNTGTDAWAVAGNYRLGSASPQNNTVWATFIRVPLSADVPPGGQATFSFACTAPASAGSFPFAWQMLQENVAWFGAVASKTISVVSPPPPFPPPRPDPDDLLSYGVLNTGPYGDGNTPHTAYWQNDTGRDLEIVGCYLWTGMDFGARADVQVMCRRESDGTQLHVLAWDHYAEKNAPNHGVTRWYAPYKVVLAQGERLRFDYFFNPISGATHAHHYCEIFVRSGP